MFNFIKKLFNRIGLNKAVLTSLLAKSWQMLAGALTLFFVAHYFSSAEQGYFYTFNSVLGLQVIFEMGLSFVILQFSGHFFAHLRWGASGRVDGDPVELLKFQLLLRDALLWYTVAACIMAAILIPAGIYFFNQQSTHSLAVNWQMPWICLVVFTAFNLLTVPSLAAIEGGGQVARVNRLKLMQGIVSSTLSWALLIYGVGLWIAVIPMLIAFLSSSYWLGRYFPKLISGAIVSGPYQAQSSFSWKHDVWPMQWRIAISWISGFFIFQLFTPVLFYYHGPLIAGKMGMSISIATVLTSVGFVWLQANSPKLTRLAALKEWKEFDRSFFSIFLQSFVFVLLGGLAIIAVLSRLDGFTFLERVLPLNDMMLLLLAFVISHIIGSLAYYLRLHKREPMMLLSLIGAMILSTGILYFGRSYGAHGMALVLLSVNLFYGLPTTLWLWARLRKAWH